MIVYHLEVFGFHLLSRAHGSAVYKAILPATLSTCILLIGVYGFDKPSGEGINIVTNFYAIGAFIAFFTYLVTFRANFAYGRYWEGATAVYQMMSKWLDVGMNIAAYHYQCRQYSKVRPPTFGKNPTVRNLTRERERQERMSEEEMKETLLKQEEEERRQYQMHSHNVYAIWREKRRRRKLKKSLEQKNPNRKSIHSKSATVTYSLPAPSESLRHHGRGQHRRGKTRVSQQFDNDFLHLVAQEHTKNGGVDTPSLFLQESAHLLSLLSAVAMSTLRSDILDAEPELVEHIPGRPWPPEDPDCLSPEIRKEFNGSSRIWTAMNFLLGFKRRSNREVMLYNAARPFRVLGGVSDEEMEALSEARGPEAKVSLCSKWLQEFITREYLAGSTGGVAPPIISRLYQFLSDGMLGYNQSRKISYIPFPFPHAQLTIFFIGVCVFVFPLLYYSYVNQLAFACILNFTTVMCFVGVHEVARELEQPFRNVPNDLPLTTFQAQFNEALIAMYAGFHPDAWSVEDQVATSNPSIPNTNENEGMEQNDGADGEGPSTRRHSLDSLDLLSFFRKEREEVGEQNTPSSSPGPKSILKKAAPMFHLRPIENNEEQSLDSLTVTKDDSESILKGAEHEIAVKDTTNVANELSPASALDG